ncbi:reverse transcriptase domain-containing protein [Tanacetum coccineum]
MFTRGALNTSKWKEDRKHSILIKLSRYSSNYDAKTDISSIDEPPEVELKYLPPHLEYAFLEDDDKLPVIISKDLSMDEKAALIKVLKSRKRAIAWKLFDIKGINPEFCTHKILMEEDYITGCATKTPERDQRPTEISEKRFLLFLEVFSGYFQIPIDPKDQEKTTFTCPYGTFAYRHMPFGLCNAPGTFQRCMLAIFHDMVEKTMEVFMDDFWPLGNSFKNCLLLALDKCSKGPTSGIRATKGTLHKIEHRSKPLSTKSNNLSAQKNQHDVIFPLHDDEELSLHDDASLAGSVPATNKEDAPAKPPQIITTNTLSNIKLPVLQKDIMIRGRGDEH